MGMGTAKRAGGSEQVVSGTKAHMEPGAPHKSASNGPGLATPTARRGGSRRVRSVHGAFHADLRRKHSREFVQEILRRAQLLPEGQDGGGAVLIRAVFEEGMPFAKLSALTGVSVRTARRCVHRLIARVMSPDFDFVMEHSRTWPTMRRKVAYATLVLGRSFRQVSKELGLSLHTVRQHHLSAVAVCEAARILAADAHAAGVVITSTPLRKAALPHSPYSPWDTEGAGRA